MDEPLNRDLGQSCREPIGRLPADHAAILSACPHFAVCGGCTDLGPKDDVLPAALIAAGYPDPPVRPPALSPIQTRRRMDLAARRVDAGVELGLHRHRSHDLVDLHSCGVLHPDLVALFAPLRDVLRRLDLFRRTGSVIANRLENGIDLLLRTDAPASRHDRARLATFAGVHGIARVSHAAGTASPEPIAELRRPMLRMSGVTVHPAPGAFLQATEAGEAAITAAVLAGLPERLPRRGRIAELYAGSGTLSFALAGRARVDAFEADATAVATLDRACRDAGLAGRLVVAIRDLVRQPLMARDLAPYEVVVLDPPAAGAPIQIGQLAQAGVPRVVYVSCEPRSLARDAAALRGAGYKLLSATPIDQFIGAPRVESVCVFDRPLRRARS